MFIQRKTTVIGPILLLACVLAIFGVSNAAAQTTLNPSGEAGIKPFGTYDSTAIDSINFSNGRLTLHIKIASIPQRGNIPFGFNVVYKPPMVSRMSLCDPGIP